ncbi:hypothetical protein V490_00476 [Pseudogymnoascus sp. VKM F-3557]|nr:hypothetical protein V490_00476 [Pseudogymnoascus sp. VKM F-3557]
MLYNAQPSSSSQGENRNQVSEAEIDPQHREDESDSESELSPLGSRYQSDEDGNNDEELDDEIDDEIGDIPGDELDDGPEDPIDEDEDEAGDDSKEGDNDISMEEEDADEQDGAILELYNYYGYTMSVHFKSRIGITDAPQYIWLTKPRVSLFSLNKAAKPLPPRLDNIAGLEGSSDTRKDLYMVVGIGSLDYESYKEKPIQSGFETVEVQKGSYIALIHASEGSVTRFCVLAKDSDGTPAAYNIPNKYIFFFGSISEELAIEPGQSKPTSSKTRVKEWTAAQRALVSAGSNDSNFQAPQPKSKKRKQLKAGQDDAATRPLLQRHDQYSLLLENTTIVLGILELRPDDRDIALSQYIARIKTESPELVEQRSPFEAIRKFLDPIHIPASDIICTTDENDEWETWIAENRDGVTLCDFHAAREVGIMAKEVWDLQFTTADMIRLRIGIKKFEGAIPYDACEALFIYTSIAKERHPDFDAEEVINTVVRLTNTIPRDPNWGKRQLGDDGWRQVLTAVRDALERICLRFRDDVAAVEAAIGAKMGRYESFEEAVGGLATSPDLHSAEEVIDRLAHHACKIASARSEAVVDTIGTVIGWIDKVIKK